MYAQIEITTICNFTCFYCAGRDMPQEHMTWECFEDVLGRLPEGRYTVSLQGEGEPMAHRDFWRMTERVASLGKVPYTITNGSLLRHPQRVADNFETIGISIDTLDAEEAERIGRRRLPRVLKNLERLLGHMDPERIIVHTVDYGQPLGPLREYLTRLGIGWQITQGIQQKPDYSYRYPSLVRFIRREDYTYACRYISAASMRYFNVRGLEMPCCFIKDTRHYVSAGHIATELAAQRVPGCCTGCREILAPQRNAA